MLATARTRLKRAKIAGNSRPKAPASPQKLESLGHTPREAEFLFWLAHGKTNAEIGTNIGVQLTTVKQHLEGIPHHGCRDDARKAGSAPA